MSFEYVVGMSKSVNGCFKGVSSKFQGWLRMLQECFKEAQGDFKKVSRMLQECFNGVSKEFKASFKEGSRGVQGIFNVCS